MTAVTPLPCLFCGGEGHLAARTDAELADAGLLPDGDYDFEVVDAGSGQSKSGNDMMTLTLAVFDGTGQRRTIMDYLIAINKPLPMKKIKQFAYAIGMISEYDAGDLPAHRMAGRSGRAKIGRQEASGGYDPRNQVSAYLPRNGGVASATRAPAPARELDDEIPF